MALTSRLATVTFGVFSLSPLSGRLSQLMSSIFRQTSGRIRVEKTPQRSPPSRKISNSSPRANSRSRLHGGPPLATYATDAKTVVGADPDYALAVADSLGLELELVAVARADWPLGLASGKYDAVISNVGVTEQRKEKFDFSTYRQGLHGFS